VRCESGSGRRWIR